MTPRFLAVVVCLVAVNGSFAEDWLRFRGTDGTGVTDTAAPIEWSDESNIAWKSALPGPGASSPIVVGSQIFLTCYSGYGSNVEEPGERSQLECETMCLDRTSGEILWRQAIPAADAERNYEGFIQQHGYSSATPCSDGEHVYAFFGSSGVVAYDLLGQQLWHVSVGTKTHGFGSGASPILHGDLLIVNASIESGRLIALNKQTGVEVWSVEEAKRCWGTPLIVQTESGDEELVLNVDSQMKGFDPETGEVLWTCEAIPDYVCPSVVARNGIVYGIGGRKSHCVAVKTGGRGDVTETHRLFDLEVGSNVPSPVLVGNNLFWVNQGGQFFCVDVEKAELVTRERTKVGKTYASMMSAGGKLYVVSRQDGAFVFEASPELTQVAHNVIESDDSIFNGTPVFHGGQLFLRSDQFLYCIGEK
ncbi:MAG: PQQ-binding-like beta-propeller repeat protein [Planctomycetaceae bacterium]|nr:PQQ-binding-like beta-propeller repeat protein [Planctomycetaceae bacterium]